MNKKELKAQIIRKDYPIDKFIKELEISKATFYTKQNSDGFSTKEIKKIRDLLELSRDQIFDIFFA